MLNTKKQQKEHRTTLNKKLLVKVAILCLACSLLTGIAVYASTPTTISTISPGNYAGATSYTIFTDGTNIFAKNNLGEVMYSGVDYATVTNNAITALSADTGGTILLTAGEYEITTSIILKPGITLRGEGNFFSGGIIEKATILEATADLDEPVIFANNIRQFNIYDLTINGRDDINTGADSRGIKTVDSYVFKFENVEIMDCYGGGIRIENCTVFWIDSCRTQGMSNGDDIYLDDTTADWHIMNCQCGYGSTTNGILTLDGAGYGEVINNVFYLGTRGIYAGTAIEVRIIGNRLNDCNKQGLYMGSCTDMIVTGNHIKSNGLDEIAGSRAGIKIASCTDCIISDNRIWDDIGTTQQYGIEETDSSDKNIINAVNARDNSVMGILTVGTDTYVSQSWNGTTWVS